MIELEDSSLFSARLPNMRKPYCRVAAFIDWNSQLWLSGIDAREAPLLAARAAFKSTTRRVAACLHATEPEVQFQVDLRLYNGWHKGYEPSANRKAIKQVIAETDFSVLSTKPKIVFSAEIGLGDCLLSALPSRMHAAQAIHLPNTLRERDRKFEEKMVDTALASDLIVTAYQEPEDWILVAAEDDDLVPPIFVAEAIVKRAGARVLLLSSRKRTKNFLKLDDISVEHQ